MDPQSPKQIVNNNGQKNESNKARAERQHK